MTDTRSRLLAEGEQLIRKLGYSGFSYADLANVMGLRKASIHHHFPAKDDLVAGTLAQYRARYRASFAAIEEAHAGALERVMAYAALFRAGAGQGVGCLCAALAVEHDALPEGLKRAAAHFFDEHLAWLERVYADGAERGEVNRHLAAPQAARLVLSGLEGGLIVARTCGSSSFEGVLGGLEAVLRPPPGGTAVGDRRSPKGGRSPPP